MSSFSYSQLVRLASDKLRAFEQDERSGTVQCSMKVRNGLPASGNVAELFHRTFNASPPDTVPTPAQALDQLLQGMLKNDKECHGVIIADWVFFAGDIVDTKLTCVQNC